MTAQRKHNPLAAHWRRVKGSSTPPGQKDDPLIESRNAPIAKPRKYDPLAERRHNTPITPEVRAGYITTRVGDAACQEAEVKNTAELLIVSAFLDEDWKVQGVSRRAWTDSTLPSNASATWRSRFEGVKKTN